MVCLRHSEWGRNQDRRSYKPPCSGFIGMHCCVWEQGNMETEAIALRPQVLASVHLIPQPFLYMRLFLPSANSATVTKRSRQ